MNPAKEFSIEYSHIYTNNKVGKEHEFSLEVLRDLYKEEKMVGQSRALVILVDDYSFPDPTFDYNEFSKWLTGNGFGPDLILQESELIPLCDQVLTLVKDEKIKGGLIDYITTKKKYPCSLFVASWYLLRLGHISLAAFNEKYVASNLINILPLSFKPFEEKALEIISSTKYSGSVGKIAYKYFEGRLVA